MTEMLLRTKLFVPPMPPELVSRPRLMERFENGLHRKLTLVSAPAGFGKTTLLSEWAHMYGIKNMRTHLSVAWVSLDKNDNDPSLFWTYLIAAFQTIHPEIGHAELGMIRSPQPPPIESVLTSLINDLIKRPEPFLLLLDDYHLIENDAIHRAMSFFLEHMPRQIHVVVASRIDPPLSLALLRGRGQLNVFNAADLRFTYEETNAFFNEVMKLGLSKLGVKALENRTEGWVASMQMAAISMKGHPDITKFIYSFSGSQRYVLDYLTEEVFSRQPEDVQTFLLQTSILERLSVPLCDFVTQRNDALQKLDFLEAANLFIMPLDDERKWFRYHPLFADLLRNQLDRMYPDMSAPLHYRASQWFEQEGMTVESIDHALASRDLERAANLIESVAVPMIVMESKVSTLLNWLTRLPNELITTRPWLCIALAASYLATGKLDEIEPLLKAAEDMLPAKDAGDSPETLAEHKRIRSVVIAVRANTASLQGDIERTPELCHEALKQLPEDETFARAPIALNLGVAYAMRGEMAVADQYLNEAAALGKETGNPYLALIAMGCLAETQAKQGFLHRAAETNRNALQFGLEHGYSGEPLSATCYAHMSLAQILYQWNELSEAVLHMTTGMQLREQCGNALIVLLCYPGSLLLNEFQNKTGSGMDPGDFSRAVIHAPYNALVSQMADAWQARLALANGDLKAVERWASSQKLDLHLAEPPDFWQEFSYLTVIRLRIAQGRIDDVIGMLEQLQMKAEAENRMGSVIEILVLTSISLELRGNVDGAMEMLENALTIAESEGYIRMFVDEGVQMKELLTQAASRGIRVDYVDRLLKVFEQPNPLFVNLSAETESVISKDTPVVNIPARQTEILSGRELEILRLVAAGATSKEIASTLILSIGTVKKHITNIYRKLDVHKRTMAVSKAQELGLL